MAPVSGKYGVNGPATKWEDVYGETRKCSNKGAADKSQRDSGHYLRGVVFHGSTARGIRWISAVSGLCKREVRPSAARRRRHDRLTQHFPSIRYYGRGHVPRLFLCAIARRALLIFHSIVLARMWHCGTIRCGSASFRVYYSQYMRDTRGVPADSFPLIGCMLRIGPGSETEGNY